VRISNINGSPSDTVEALRTMYQHHDADKIILEVGGDGAVHQQEIQGIRFQNGALILSGEPE
jgi:hypothetical protein